MVGFLRTFFCILIVWMLGCKPSIQSGKYLSGGTLSVFTNSGTYVELRGSEAQSHLPERALLRVVIVNRSGSAITLASEHVGSDSRLFFRTADGNLLLKVYWNRGTDQVSIGDQSFDRIKGESFVVVGANDSWDVFQGKVPEHVREAKEIASAFRDEFRGTVAEIENLTLADVKIPK